MNLPLETPTGRVDGCVSKETLGLFFQLRDRFNDNMMREVILAACGLKVARTCMSDDDLLTFLPVAERNNLQVVLSPEKYIHRKDIGKGGWSNSLERTVPTDHDAGLFNVYIATDKYLADLGLKTEEDNYEDEFGLLLGIPECCRNAYVEGHELARLKQNDLVPIVLDNTTGPPPYNFWNNYVAQYFGRALLSFFPCSFNCAFAADLARMSFSVLQQCSRSWADRFMNSQKTNILYTEYLGIHEFPGSCCMDGWMNYDPRLITSTENTQISQYLMSGNKLKVLGKHGVEIYNGDRVVKRLEDEDVSVCLFVGNGVAPN